MSSTNTMHVPGASRRAAPRPGIPPQRLDAPAKGSAASSVPGRALTSAEARAVLALSDERDMWLARVLDAERRARAAGRVEGYSAGYLDGVAARKHAEHLLADIIGTLMHRWGGLRRDFGRPRPGDWPGLAPRPREAWPEPGADPVRARAEEIARGHALGLDAEAS